MNIIRTFRVLVSGARECTPGDATTVRMHLHDVCIEHHRADQGIIIVHGGATGVDDIASRWARQCAGVDEEQHRADWDRHGRKAGPVRNAEMVNLGADICLGFPGPLSRGTWDLLHRAVRAGIHTRIYPLEGLS